MTTIVTNYDKMPKTDFEVLFSYLNSFVMHEHFIFSVCNSAKVFMCSTTIYLWKLQYTLQLDRYIHSAEADLINFLIRYQSRMSLQLKAHLIKAKAIKYSLCIVAFFLIIIAHS